MTFEYFWVVLYFGRAALAVNVALVLQNFANGGRLDLLIVYTAAAAFVSDESELGSICGALWAVVSTLVSYWVFGDRYDSDLG